MSATIHNSCLCPYLPPSPVASSTYSRYESVSEGLLRSAAAARERGSYDAVRGMSEKIIEPSENQQAKLHPEQPPNYR